MMIDSLVVSYLGMVDQAAALFGANNMSPAQIEAARAELTARSSQLRMQLAQFLPEPAPNPANDPVDVLERARKRVLDAEREARQASNPGPAALLPAPNNSQ